MIKNVAISEHAIRLCISTFEICAHKIQLCIMYYAISEHKRECVQRQHYENELDTVIISYGRYRVVA